MTDPKVFDFSAPDEDAITIVFPGGKHSCELPTMEQLNMETFQWVAANGDEWYRLADKKNLSAAERKRFDHLNRHLAYALCEGVPRDVVDKLSVKQKAQVIIGFMSASPGLLKKAQEMAAKASGGAKPRSRTSR